MSDKSCFNIHFDSLASGSLASSTDFSDPTFFDIADRFLELSGKRGFKYTISVIGRDLENPGVAQRIKEWSMAGHEIANHSYNHKENLGCLDYDELEMEVMKSHEIIAKVCGKEPKGFVAPGWAASTNLVNILLKHDYLYDTSVFPSYFMWLLLARIRWNCRNPDRKSTLLQRSDWTANLFACTKPYFSNGKSLAKKETNGLLIIPLPVTPILKIPCWHSMAFSLPKIVFNSVLASCLSRKYFYYVLHPADMMDKQDIPVNAGDTEYIYRLNVPLAEKIRMFNDSTEQIFRHSSSIATLEQIAKEIRDQMK